MSRTADEVFLLVFGGIAVILITARVVGAVFVRLGQPAVVGEVVGGLLLGPSALGLLPGDPSQLLFPSDIQPYLRVIAAFGLIIYLFIVGLELDLRAIRTERRAAVSISLASIALPFVLGAACGWLIFTGHDTATELIGGVAVPVEVDRLTFVLFCGLAISGSAFAILARILDERGLFRTRIGGVLLASTVVDDIVVWILASVVLAIAASGGLAGVPLTLLGLIAFVAVLFVLVRPALRSIIRTRLDDEQGLDADLFAVILVGLLGAALYTTWLGISPILGAFFFGAAVPREGTARMFSQVNERLESVSVLVLLPVFFAVTGLGVDLSTIGLGGLGLLVLFVAAATVGKMAGAAIGSSFNGIRGRRALGVGVLMNTRGLTELALLSLGSTLGVLDTTMFTVLVCTAIVTTLMSGPMLRLVYPDRMIDVDIAAAERSRLASASGYRLMIHLDDLEAADPTVIELGADLVRGELGSQLIVNHLDTSGRRSELGAGVMADLASITDSLDRLRELTRGPHTTGVDVLPRSQRTPDVVGELVTQARSIQPHLVLVPATAESLGELVTRLIHEAEVDVAVFHPGDLSGGDLGTVTGAVIGAGNEPHQTLATELGLRFGLGTGLPLAIIDGRRQQASEALARELGIPITDSVEQLSPVLHVLTGVATGVAITGGAGTSPIGGDPVLVVHAHDRGTGPRRLDDIRERLIAP